MKKVKEEMEIKKESQRKKGGKNTSHQQKQKNVQTAIRALHAVFPGKKSGKWLKKNYRAMFTTQKQACVLKIRNFCAKLYVDLAKAKSESFH